MDRLNAMRLFVRLVECGSFSAVGREEGIGQPAVSKQIQALEQYLGAQLVLRTSRQVVITDAGQTFYESARRLLDDVDAVESSVGERQQAPRGLIRINTSPAHGRLCITPLLGEFFRRYPQVTVELSVSELQVDLLSEGIDLAIRHGPLVDSSLTARKLSQCDFVLVASTDYLARHAAPVRLDDLEQHACVVFARGREARPWHFRKGRERIAYRPHGPIMSGDAEHIRAAVLAGLGIAQVPFWILGDAIASGQVKILLPEWQPEPLATHIVYAAGRRIPMRARVLIDYLVEAFSSARA